MVTRRGEDGQFYGRDQRLDRKTALRIMTMGSAYYILREKQLGSLEAGKWADLAVLDKDFMQVPDEELDGMKVLMTLVDGKPMFAEPSFAQEIKWAGISSHKAIPPESNTEDDRPERE
jgi:predicted amidohydrolase YtcJ